MKKLLQLPLNSTTVGDVLKVLRSWPDKSVQTVVTSPPYWGLRDYGTATWIGGDPECDHKGKPFRTSENINLNTDSGGSDVKNKTKRQPMKGICTKCGANRVDQQLGLEETPQLYIKRMVKIFRELRRVLRDDGTLWLNLGDSYNSRPSNQNGRKDAGSTIGNVRFYSNGDAGVGRKKFIRGLKPKDMVGIPWRVALALQADGWYLRQDIIWNKPNPMPESVNDRCTKAHEYIFLMTKKPKYYYDAEAIKEDAVEYEVIRRTRELLEGKIDKQYDIGRDDNTGQANQSLTGAVRNAKRRQELGASGKRNKRSVWEITTQNFPDAHFATFPEELPEICIKAGTSDKGCCARCGAPWKRIIKNGEPNLDHQIASGGDINGEYHGKSIKDYASSNAQDASATKARILAGMVEKVTIGWLPTCKCVGAGDPVPCVVADIFSGSGTTHEISRRLGRNFAGVELNPSYKKMEDKRIHKSMGMFK